MLRTDVAHSRPAGVTTVTQDQIDSFAALSGFDQALLWADDNGFVYCDLMWKEN
jgi:hypothetical protein